MGQGNATKTGITIGLDLGDRYTHVCVLDEGGAVLERQRVLTRPASLRRLLASYPPSRVVLEVGAHSPWVSRLVSEVGHEAVVAPPTRSQTTSAPAPPVASTSAAARSPLR